MWVMRSNTRLEYPLMRSSMHAYGRGEDLEEQAHAPST